MKVFIAFILCVVVGYAAYYVIENKDDLLKADRVRLSTLEMDYIAPNKINNPGNLYAEKDGQMIWKTDFSAVSINVESAEGLQLPDYKVFGMQTDVFAGKEVLLVKAGSGTKSRTYIFERRTGAFLGIERDGQIRMLR